MTIMQIFQGPKTMKKRGSLEQSLTGRNLLALAGATIHARGESYQCSGAVSDLRLVNDRLSADVADSSFASYETSLWAEDVYLDYACSCPMGEGGDCCKHVVAVGLVWLADPGQARSRSKKVQHDAALLRQFLLQQSKETLADWLLAQGATNTGLYQELKAKATLGGATPDLKSLKKTLTEALTVRDFMSSTQTRDMIGRVRKIIVQVEQLGETAQGSHAGLIAALAEHAMLRGLACYQKLDDSSGRFNEFLHELSAWYLTALTAAGTTHPLTAAQYFKLQSMDEWEFFSLQEFGPLLSAAEYKKYRSMAQAAWDKVPALKSGKEKPPSAVHSMSQFRTTRIMEEIAEYENDIDFLVTIKSHNLSSPWAYLEAANVLKSAKRHDEALTMAERGLKAFPDKWDERLVTFLLEEYRGQKAHDAAFDLAWRHYQAVPSLKTYQTLKQLTETGGSWPTLRQQALEYISSSSTLKKPGNTLWRRAWELLEIHLHEQNLAEALDTAYARGATDAQWLRLACAFEQERPLTAAGIYCKQVERTVAVASPATYQRAVDMIDILRRLMQSNGQTTEYTRWLTELCAKHKAKRKFMEKLRSVMGT